MSASHTGGWKGFIHKPDLSSLLSVDVAIQLPYYDIIYSKTESSVHLTRMTKIQSDYINCISM